MHHLATLTEGPFPGKPHRVQCACGSSGDFNLKEQAENWFSIHTSRIGPTETSALVVPGAADDAPAPPPAPPAPSGQPSKENEEPAT